MDPRSTELQDSGLALHARQPNSPAPNTLSTVYRSAAASARVSLEFGIC